MTVVQQRNQGAAEGAAQDEVHVAVAVDVARGQPAVGEARHAERLVGDHGTVVVSRGRRRNATEFLSAAKRPVRIGPIAVDGVEVQVEALRARVQVILRRNDVGIPVAVHVRDGDRPEELSQPHRGERAVAVVVRPVGIALVADDADGVEPAIPVEIGGHHLLVERPRSATACGGGHGVRERHRRRGLVRTDD